MRMILNRLGELRPGDRAHIHSFRAEEDLENFLTRLFEIGFIEGVEIEVLHEAPWSRDPMSVRIKDAVYVLRRAEADLIQVVICE